MDACVVSKDKNAKCRTIKTKKETSTNKVQRIRELPPSKKKVVA